MMWEAEGEEGDKARVPSDNEEAEVEVVVVTKSPNQAANTVSERKRASERCTALPVDTSRSYVLCPLAMHRTACSHTSRSYVLCPIAMYRTACSHTSRSYVLCPIAMYRTS